MTRIVRTIGLSFLLLTLGGQASAQWPDWPTRNVPRTPDGEVDMQAPTPRTIDGHVDFSGIWMAGRAGGFGGGGRGGFGGRGGRGGNAAPGAAPGGAAPGAGAPGGGGRGGAGAGGRGGAGAGGGGAPGGNGLIGGPNANGDEDDSPPVAQFFNVGAGMPGGEPPYNERGRAIFEARRAANAKDNPDAHCLPMGHMQFHLHPQPRQMIQTEDEILILYEGNSGLRQIYLDGRPSPDNEPLPWWYGYSTGHWEGDELVVVTTHMKDDGWLDVNGSPFTSHGTITERFRRPNFGSLEIDVTIDDPTVYTEPFTVRVNQRIIVDTSLIEFVCIENEQSSEYYIDD